jgi:hypothetical protein
MLTIAQPLPALKFIVWMALLLCCGDKLAGQDSVLLEVPFDAPSAVVLDHGELLSPAQQQEMEKEAMDLIDQTGIRLWVVTLPAAGERETRRAITRRAHTWVQKGLGLVLGLSADPNIPPRLGVSQDLLVELTESEIRKLREDVLTAWEEEGEPSLKPLAATRAVSGNLDLYRIDAAADQALPEIFGLSSRQFKGTDDPASIRGRYRERMEIERQWEQEINAPSEVTENTPPQPPPRFFETLAWRTQVWIINLALFAVIASAGIWFLLNRLGQERDRRRQMEEGARQLVGRPRGRRSMPDPEPTDEEPTRKHSPQQVDNEDVY